MIDEKINQTAAHLFRQESGKMLAVLTRLFGLRQVEIAEDIVQETLLAAFESWKLKGLPDDPRAWLYRTAKNKTIDFLRRERNFQVKIAPKLLEKDPTRWLEDFFLEGEIQDAQLRMMFACCSPAISVEQQLALILKTLGGLSVREIAATFFEKEETTAKKIFRAKEKMRLEKLETPVGSALLPRLDGVLQAVYLLFNEGYRSASSSAVIRLDFCAEAMRLGEILTKNAATALPKSHALQSLMAFQAARFASRIDEKGQTVLLEKQDRSRWNQPLIALGYAHLSLASAGEKVSEYHLEAAIASYHASAPTFEKTNWTGIFYCYELLFQMTKSPVVALQRAIALGFRDGAEAGLAALFKIEGLRENAIWHAATGDFLAKKGDQKAALEAYQKAVALTVLPAERLVLETKMAALA